MKVKEKHQNKLIEELIAIKEEVRNDVTGPVVASFGFIIALIWRDAIQSGINEFLKRSGLSGPIYFYQFISAVIVTVIVIIIIVIVTKLGRKRQEKKIEKAINKKLSKS